MAVAKEGILSVTGAGISYRPPMEPMVSTLAGAKSPGWWGMVWLIATEAMLFACFFAAYLFLHGPIRAFAGEGGKYPSVAYMIPMTILLLSSSVSTWWGERGIKQGSATRLRAGYAVTFVLGAAFLTLQVFEFRDRQFGPTASAYQSLFYTITSFHGAHVAIGLMMNLFVQVRAWLGHFDARRYDAVENASLYWHFVDAVWIVIVAVLYLSPRLW
jgi:heme/copper-type cytochrome/quinol oxidase subunit 3